MIEIQRILCPIDFSDFSRHAFAHAAAIARWYESGITVLHVTALVPAAAYGPGAPILSTPALTDAQRQDLLTAMERFAESEGGRGVPLEFAVSEGPVATEILEQAERRRAGLIVMGTHGRSGFERLVLGSVTEKVLRKASCPVLSVPRSDPGVAPAAVLFKNIVCAIDFSDCSMKALDYAMSLAQEADGRLTVVHVLELPPGLPADRHENALAGPRTLGDYIAAAEEDRRARLQEAIPERVRAFCTVETVLATGKPYREILRIAAEQSSDLIVIGVHGRGAADLLFFGSTAQHIVRQATCPVLTLRGD